MIPNCCKVLPVANATPQQIPPNSNLFFSVKFVFFLTFPLFRNAIHGINTMPPINVRTQLNDGVKMSCIQFFICGILCFVPMMLFEHPEISMILLAWKPILYAGVMSCGVAYTLQIVGQKNMNPTVASLILSLESVTSVIAGFLVLHQNLSHRELIGCGLMFIAIVLAQLPQKI